MQNKIIIFIMCLICQFGFGQNETRKPLHGQVVNDSINLENGFVDNINSKLRTFISPSGFFDLMIKENDTLLFTGTTFQPKRVIIYPDDITKKLVFIRVIAIPNQLKEVVVKKINPNLGNVQSIIDKKYVDDEKSALKNRLMPPDGSIENGMDFVRIFKGIFKLIRGNHEKKNASTPDANFTEMINEKFKSSFFTNTLKINEHQIGLFLIFCENDSKSKKIMNSDSEFEIMDFLITKSKEFNASNTLK